MPEAQVLWSEPALEDLRAVVEYMRRYSPERAERVGRAILSAADRLAMFSLSGRMVPEFPALPFREVIVEQHRLIYRVGEENQVFILALVHTRRHLPEAVDLESRLP